MMLPRWRGTPTRLRPALEHGFRNHEQRPDIVRTKAQSSEVCDEGKVLCLPALRPRYVHTEKELGKRETQGVGERRQRHEMRYALRALDHGEKGNADTGLLGELFLCERARLAYIADALTELHALPMGMPRQLAAQPTQPSASR